LDAVQAYVQGRLSGRPAQWGDVVFQGLEWLFLGALLPIVSILARRFPLRAATWKRALIAHLMGASLLCVGWASLGVALGTALHRYPEHAWGSWVLTTIPWSIFMYFTVLGCVHAFTYFVEAREREAQLAEARLGALQAQIQPHFLFNSLNAITVLVREQNTPAATRMLELLGDVLRRVIKADTRHEIPLAEDLQFLRDYLAIEEVRFSDRLRVTWSIEEEAQRVLVPSFLLQPIVENALKHGIAKKAEAGRIEIAARIGGGMLELRVRDDGAGMSDTRAEGVGLLNTRERLRTLYGGRASLTIHSEPDGGMEVVIRIPA
jgi:signal transduction histidine kinase